MKYTSKFFLLLLVFFALWAESDSKKAESKLFVRVLLEEKECANKPLWEINSEDKMLVIDLENPSRKLISQQLHVNAEEDINILEADKVMLDKLHMIRIIPRDGYVCINGIWYQGSLNICLEDKRVLLINSLDLEDYIFSVIKSEGWPGWPVEVNKVFAIASRSYVIAKVLEAQQQGKKYHIKNTNAHQRYNGYHDTMEIRTAVNETRDIFLAFDGQPILAMFDICCGGVIPAKKKGVNFNHAPYLARTYACTYCKPFKVFNWSATYPLEEIEQLFKPHVPELKNLKEIKVTKKDDAGLVTEVLLKASSGYHYVRGKKVYSTLKKVRSLCFSVERKKSKSIELKGRGFGHHMGLCQWGTRRMVQEGWPADRILKFFYPGTTFMRLTAPQTQEQTYA